jgi:hypothetical protein
VTHGSLVGAAVVPALPGAAGARTSAQQTPGGAPRSSREVEPNSGRPAFRDALVAAYMRALSQVPLGGRGEAPPQGG